MAKKTTIRLLVLILLLTSYSCTKTGDKTLIIGADSTEKIERGRLSGIRNIDNLIISPLFMPDDKSDVHGILVKEVRSSRDRRVWNIWLKNGVAFHNGEGLTARDVVSAIETAGALPIGLLKKTGHIEAEGEDEVKIVSDSPIPNIYSALSHIYVYPGGRQTPSDVPIGSGPFKVKKWLDNGAELAANDGYFDGRPGVDKIIYTWDGDEGNRTARLLEGKADLLSKISPVTARFLSNDKRFFISMVSIPYYVAIFFNNKSQIFGDRGVRKAINMAIDMDMLIEKGLEGAGVKASGPFLVGTWPANPEVSPYKYEPKRAAHLLKEAGWLDNTGDGLLRKEGRELRLRLFYVKEVKEFKKVVDIIAQQLFEIGVMVEGIPVSGGQEGILGKAFGDHDAVLGIFNTHIDPDITSIVWQSSGDYNLSSYSNKEVDRLFEEGRKALNMEERKRIYNEIHRIIRDDAPAAFLYHPVWFTAVNKRFKGAENFKGDPYSWYKIKDWSLNEGF